MNDGLVADGVFSGGGVKAIAFAGALKAAEAAGYRRWMQLSGTSAGAITAAALAVGYDADGLTERLMDMDVATIADIGRPRRFSQLRNLLAHHSLARGLSLHSWIEKLLADAPSPARTFGELDGRLRVVATDLVHRRMVILPDDAPNYLDPQGERWEADALPIADAVRMSAGYPFMFAPVALTDAVSGRPAALVDGGIVSGFPVFLFDTANPCHPTWGFRLVDERPYGTNAIAGVSWPVDMVRAILETSINAHDRMQADSFGQRTVVIHTGSIPTLKFDLSRADKLTLWQAGHDAAAAFMAAGPSATNSLGAAPPAHTLPAPLPSGGFGTRKETKHSADRRAEQKGTEYV